MKYILFILIFAMNSCSFKINEDGSKEVIVDQKGAYELYKAIENAK